MTSPEHTPWSLAVRVLAVVSGVLLMVVLLEARTVRLARAELQQLRTEREQAKTLTMAGWTQQSLSETTDALSWLDEFYAEPTEGFGRTGGLCADSRLDPQAITSYLVGGYLSARGEGKSHGASLAAMRAAILRSDAYRALHPNLAAPTQGR